MSAPLREASCHACIVGILARSYGIDMLMQAGLPPVVLRPFYPAYLFPPCEAIITYT